MSAVLPSRELDVAAIMLAAGAGERLRSGAPKALVPIAGRTILEHALLAMMSCRAISTVVVVAPSDRLDEVRRTVAVLRTPLIRSVVAGGHTRQSSVRLGLEAVPVSADVVLCHDAARPLATPALFDTVLGALSRTGADGVVPVVESPDTVKRIQGGRVVGTYPREQVALAQTPQGFRASALRAAHAEALSSGREATDDAALLEAIGFRVVTVPGEALNFKITSQEDLERAARHLSIRRVAAGGAGG